MEAIKAAPLGALLSAVISVVIGSQGSQGGRMAIHLVEISNHSFHWSWPLFFAGSGLAYGLMIMQR